MRTTYSNMILTRFRVELPELLHSGGYCISSLGGKIIFRLKQTKVLENCEVCFLLSGEINQPRDQVTDGFAPRRPPGQFVRFQSEADTDTPGTYDIFVTTV
jgi:hypothetical protein